MIAHLPTSPGEVTGIWQSGQEQGTDRQNGQLGDLLPIQLFEYFFRVLLRVRAQVQVQSPFEVCDGLERREKARRGAFARDCVSRTKRSYGLMGMVTEMPPTSQRLPQW